MLLFERVEVRGQTHWAGYWSGLLFSGLCESSVSQINVAALPNRTSTHWVQNALFHSRFTLQQMIIKNIRKSFKCSAVRAVVLVSVTVSKHQHSLRLQCELKSNISSLQCSIINLHPHKHSCLLGLVFVFIAVVTSQFYPAALTHESSVTFSLLFRDKAYWAPSSHSFFLLHASSGCPPLSTCADSHRTPARKRRLTTRETLAHTACVFVTGGCDGSMWRLLLSFAVWSVCCLRCSCGVVMWP